MSAPRKYEEATVARAVRMYQERQDESGESELESRHRIGELLGNNQAMEAQLGRARRRRHRGEAGNDLDRQ